MGAPDCEQEPFSVESLSMVTEAYRRMRDHRGVVVGVIALLALMMSPADDR